LSATSKSSERPCAGLEKEDQPTVTRIADYRRIIAFRNVLIHGYDVIGPAIVWRALAVDLAPLLRDVEALRAT